MDLTNTFFRTPILAEASVHRRDLGRILMHHSWLSSVDVVIQALKAWAARENADFDFGEHRK